MSNCRKSVTLKTKDCLLFDEAHVLFQDVPDVLEEKSKPIVRLIRSKGVGAGFVTQNPTDLPNAILSQLGNKIQHALRAFTPKEQKRPSKQLPKSANRRRRIGKEIDGTESRQLVSS